MASTWAPPPLALALALTSRDQPDALLPRVSPGPTQGALASDEGDRLDSDGHDDDDDDSDGNGNDSDPWTLPSRPRRRLWDLSTPSERRILIQGHAPSQLHLLTATTGRATASPDDDAAAPSSPSSLTSPQPTPARSPSAMGIHASTSLDTSLALAEEAHLASPSSAPHHADAEELLEAQYHGGRPPATSWTGAHLGHHGHHHHHHHSPRHREQSSSSSSSADPPRPTSQRVASLVGKEERRSQLLDSGPQTPLSLPSVPHSPAAAPASDALRPRALLQLSSASRVVKMIALPLRNEALVLQRDGSLTWLDGELKPCASLCLDEPSAEYTVQPLERPVDGEGGGASSIARSSSAMTSTTALNDATTSTPLLAPFSHLKEFLRSGSEADSSRAASPAPGAATWPASASMSRATSTVTAAALAKGKGRDRDAVMVSLSGLREGWRWAGLALDQSRSEERDAGNRDVAVLLWTEAKGGRARRLTQVRLDRLERNLMVTRALEVDLGTSSLDASVEAGSIRLRWMAGASAAGDEEQAEGSELWQWTIPADVSSQHHGVLAAVPRTTPAASLGLATELSSLPDGSASRVEIHAGFSVAFAEDGTARVLEESSGRLKLLGQDVLGVASAGPESRLLLALSCSEDGTLRIEEIDPDGPRRMLWSAAVARAAPGGITTALPLSLERVLAAIDGSLLLRPLSALVGCSRQSVPVESPRMSSDISVLRQTSHSRNGAKLVVAGTRQGDVGFWAVDASSTTLLAEWSLFASPLAHVLSFADDGSKLRLNGCIVAAAADGTVAVILVEGLKLLYHIPGRDAPLLLLAARSDELLLLYADSRARVWDMRSQELRRSVGLDQALSMLDDDGNGPWTRHALQDSASTSSAGVLSALSAPRSTLRADLRRAIEASSRAVETGADADVGAEVQVLLELDETEVALVPLVGSIGEENDVRLSSAKLVASPTQLLAAVAMLNVLGRVKDWQAPASAIAARLVANVTLLPLAVCLPELAVHFVDTNAEIREASRKLFEAAMDAAPAMDIERLCDEWQSLLPSRHADDHRSPTTLTLLGVVAASHFKSLSPALLKDVSASIALYISDEAHPKRQVLAIELCCRAWSVWQSYLDAMEVVRGIFGLATAPSVGGGSANAASAGAQPSQMAALLELRRSSARRATLQIAAENTPLFMTTLSLDILHARSPAHCSATMRLVAFMVRGEPLILHPNLPRLAEAVVKSLDPTATAFREAVVEAATVMIGELVRAYPTIAFHGKLQRLAVGTHEGAVIMYDLRTATRLYVIEAHRAQLSGLDFSPDGRRLVTVSVRERRALVWKVGSTLASIFAPGSLPRQGGANDAGAYKALDLNPAPNDELPSPEQPLHAVLFQWLGDRNAHVTIGTLQRSIDVS